MAAARSSKFLRLLDAAYAFHNVLKVIFDNHSAHICKKINFYSPSNRRDGSNSLSRSNTVRG